MDTSETEQGAVSSEVDSAVVASEDKIYGGVNFSAVKRELSIQKLWRERTWKEILRHFFVALIFGALGSFVDIGTDGFTAKSFISGTNYTKWVKNLSNLANHNDCVVTFNPDPEIEFQEIVCFEQDPIWGWVTVMFMIYPGFYLSIFVGRCIKDARGLSSFWDKLLLVASCCMAVPCFLLVFTLVKVVRLINPGPEWKRVNTRMTGMESFESTYQTILALFIIFTRADRHPSDMQLASLVASLAMITKTAIAEQLSLKQPMKLMDELKATATLFPLFFSNAVFKVLSAAIILTCLKVLAFFVIVVFVLVPPGLRALKKKTGCCPKRFVVGRGVNRMTSLWLEEDSKATKRQNTESCVAYEVIYGILLLTFLPSLVAAANTRPDLFMFIGIVDNLRLLNGLFLGILAAMALNAVLFYLQMWKPMVEEEEAEQREVEEVGAMSSQDLNKVSGSCPFQTAV